MVNRGERKRERKKSVDLVESRVNAEDVGQLVGLLLSQRAVYVYDIPSIGLERGLDQLVPRCCRFRDFLSI